MELIYILIGVGLSIPLGLYIAARRTGQTMAQVLRGKPGEGRAAVQRDGGTGEER